MPREAVRLWSLREGQVVRSITGVFGSPPLHLTFKVEPPYVVEATGDYHVIANLDERTARIEPKRVVFTIKGQ